MTRDRDIFGIQKFLMDLVRSDRTAGLVGDLSINHSICLKCLPPIN